MPVAVPPGWVRLVCDDPPADLVVRLGSEPLRIAAGVGGWEVTGRPRQVGMTTWTGVEPFQLELSLMLDGLATGTSVEDTLTKLVAVARGDEESPPGVLSVLGVPTPADDWVVEGMDFGDPILRNPDGERLRQPLTLTLREYVDPSYMQVRRGALQGTKGKTKVVTSKKGERVIDVARRVHCKWTQIRELNPTLARKASQHLKTGTKLRVPVAHRRRHHRK